MSVRLLKQMIQEVLLNEVDIEDLSNVCFTAGSTHVMKTCKIGKNKYFLKFSDEDLFEGVDPSLQILVEFIAYRIYGLFSGIKIPTPELVYDAKKGRVGLATTPAKGKPALAIGTDPRYLARMMSLGVYVDVFLANWDVIGTGSGNVFVDKEDATRIDPRASLTFRAQGVRKDQAYGPKAGELTSMLKKGMGAGNVYQYADLKAAADEFLTVGWPDIESEIDNVRNEVSEQLEEKAMADLLSQWNAEVDLIKGVLKKRHTEVKAHVARALRG